MRTRFELCFTRLEIRLHSCSLYIAWQPWYVSDQLWFISTRFVVKRTWSTRLVTIPYTTRSVVFLPRSTHPPSGANCKLVQYQLESRILWSWVLFHYEMGNCETLVAEQAPFASEFVASILATDSCEKSLSTLSRKSCVFSGCSGFLPQGRLSGWVRINTVRKVISHLL
jgi:hypothetical protein